MLAFRRCLLPVVVLLVLAATASAQDRVDPATGLTDNGRRVDPVGRMTQLGAFPTGGALTPDGRFYWAVDAGRGANAVRVVDVATGAVRQTLALPGGYVGIAFAPDGRHAYVSGEPTDEDQSSQGLKGPNGDVIHTYAVDPATGAATETDPIALPDARDGAASRDELPPASGVNAWPEGLDVTPDGEHLLVALGQADQVAIVDLATGRGTLANVGRYPYGVVADPRLPRAYVSNERDGTVTVLEVPSGRTLGTVAVGGSRNDYAHPEGLSVDPVRDRLYVAVTDRDLVAVVDTQALRVERYIDVGRPGQPVGSAPVNTAVAPDAGTLYVADAGEDAVVAVALGDRPTVVPAAKRFARVRSVTSIGRYRRLLAREQRSRRRAGSTPAAQRRFVRRIKVLRRQFVFAGAIQACSGPTTRQDRAYGQAVLAAYRARDRARGHGAKARRDAARAFTRATARARKGVPAVAPCPPAGFAPGAKAFSVLGRLPTAAYTVDVELTPDGRQLVWLAAKGLGTGPSTGTLNVKELTRGRAGVLATPTDRELAALTVRADRALVPTNTTTAPAGTPVVGPGGGPSQQIKHVFYVVKENRSYDQIFGSDPRGRGDPRLQVFDDNGVPGPTGGVTPNAHALSRRFSLLDNVYANSEESTQGHKITAGGYANDYVQRYTNTNRGRKGNPDVFPIGIPPNGFVFDQAVRQDVSFRAYGELGAGNQPFSDDGRPTFGAVQTSTDPAYPSQLQGTCRSAAVSAPGTPNAVRCTTDAGDVGTTHGAPATLSRMRAFTASFRQQLTAGTVPTFNYLILFNDHTDGTVPGVYSPKADLADNDLALGQLVETVSQSPIWKDSAILVVEDDSQNGMDSVDAHRMPALVISPWAKRGGSVISTRFDHYSFLRTAELITGLRPLSLNDSLATPLYDAFISGSERPDVEGTRYRAIQPQQSLTEVNPPDAPNARLSAALPFDQVDLVPQRLSDRIIWQSVFGPDSTPPPPGPNASEAEAARATGAMRALRSGHSARAFLEREAGADDGSGEAAVEREREATVARLQALGAP